MLALISTGSRHCTVCVCLCVLVGGGGWGGWSAAPGRGVMMDWLMNANGEERTWQMQIRGRNMKRWCVSVGINTCRDSERTTETLTPIPTPTPTPPCWVSAAAGPQVPSGQRVQRSDLLFLATSWPLPPCGAHRKADLRSVEAEKQLLVLIVHYCSLIHQ